ncbi:MAG: ribokinase [Acidimicrobiia bacterium]
MIVVVGSANRDLTTQVERHPLPGETVVARRMRESHGGKGANQAVAAARLGQSVLFVGAVGDDSGADDLVGELVAEGVDTSVVSRIEGPSGTAFITLADNAENSIVVVPGANGMLEISPAQSAMIATADVVLAQCEVPVDALETARNAASGIFVLNAAPAIRLPPSLIASVDVLVVNQHELVSLAGGTDPQSARSLGCATVVVTLGADGAQIVTTSDIGYVPAPDVAVRDTTGAGDAFCGAFASALSDGRDVFEASAWGVAAGSHATTIVGARSGPNRARLESLLRRNT